MIHHRYRGTTDVPLLIVHPRTKPGALTGTVCPPSHANSMIRVSTPLKITLWHALCRHQLHNHHALVVLGRACESDIPVATGPRRPIARNERQVAARRRRACTSHRWWIWVQIPPRREAGEQGWCWIRQHCETCSVDSGYSGRVDLPMSNSGRTGRV